MAPGTTRRTRAGIRMRAWWSITVAIGIDLDWALSRARGQNWEFELHRGFLPGHKGTQRVLAFVNNAHMGDYRESVTRYVEGIDRIPDIAKTARFGAVKYGV